MQMSVISYVTDSKNLQFSVKFFEQDEISSIGFDKTTKRMDASAKSPALIAGIAIGLAAAAILASKRA